MPLFNRPNKVLSLITGQAVPGNAGVAIMARIRGQDGNLITQASVSTITYTVFDIQAVAEGRSSSGTEVVSSTSQTVSAVIFDTLQQDQQLWTKDGPGDLGPDGEWGYNYRFVIPASSFTVARSGNRHRVQVLITPATGQQFRLLFEFDTLAIYS